MTVGANVKACYFSIKSAEAGLKELALASSSDENQRIYHEASMALADIKKDLHQQVLFLAREEPQYK